jgi:hypothetical protein
MPRHAALRPALTFAAALIFAASAHAIPKTYVARAGSDVNACTDAAPCRTFAGAIAKTDVGGEIVVLDAGEYGPVSITKSIRITAEGVYAGVRATSAVESAIDVNLASIGVVVLRGLSISSRGAKMASTARLSTRCISRIARSQGFLEQASFSPPGAISSSRTQSSGAMARTGSWSRPAGHTRRRPW